LHKAIPGFRSTFTASGVDRVDPDNPDLFEAPTEAGADIEPGAPLRFSDLYTHPLVGAMPGGRPSYVPSSNFASALLYVVGEGSSSLHSDLERGIAALPAGSLRTMLTTAFQNAQGDWEKIRGSIESWYDNAMDRLSGQYKRFVQLISFVLALVFALIFQLDAIAIGERLYADSILRGKLAELATTYVEKNEAAPVAAAGKPKSDKGAGTPAANASDEADASATNAADTQSLQAFNESVDKIRAARENLVSVVSLFGLDSDEKSETKDDRTSWIGILVTALAGMLGGPFWFGVLQRLVNLRGSGPKPADGVTAKGATT